VIMLLALALSGIELATGRHISDLLGYPDPWLEEQELARKQTAGKVSKSRLQRLVHYIEEEVSAVSVQVRGAIGSPATAQMVPLSVEAEVDSSLPATPVAFQDSEAKLAAIVELQKSQQLSLDFLVELQKSQQRIGQATAVEPQAQEQVQDVPEQVHELLSARAALTAAQEQIQKLQEELLIAKGALAGEKVESL